MPPRKHWSNNRSRQNNKRLTSNPHVDCINDQLQTLRKELADIEAIEKSNGETTTEQKINIAKKKASIETLEESLKRFQEEPWRTKIGVSANSLVKKEREKYKSLILKILQFFYFVRLGQYGLFDLLPAPTQPDKDNNKDYYQAFSNLCDQLIGAAVYEAAPSIKRSTREDKREEVFYLLKKLDTQSDDRVVLFKDYHYKNNNDRTNNVTFKDIQVYMQHVWDNTAHEEALNKEKKAEKDQALTTIKDNLEKEVTAGSGSTTMSDPDNERVSDAWAALQFKNMMDMPNDKRSGFEDESHKTPSNRDTQIPTLATTKNTFNKIDQNAIEKKDLFDRGTRPTVPSADSPPAVNDEATVILMTPDCRSIIIEPGEIISRKLLAVKLAKVEVAAGIGKDTEAEKNINENLTHLSQHTKDLDKFEQLLEALKRTKENFVSRSTTSMSAAADEQKSNNDVTNETLAITAAQEVAEDEKECGWGEPPVNTSVDKWTVSDENAKEVATATDRKAQVTVNASNENDGWGSVPADKMVDNWKSKEGHDNTTPTQESPKVGKKEKEQDGWSDVLADTHIDKWNANGDRTDKNSAINKAREATKLRKQDSWRSAPSNTIVNHWREKGGRPGKDTTRIRKMGKQADGWRTTPASMVARDWRAGNNRTHASPASEKAQGMTGELKENGWGDAPASIVADEWNNTSNHSNTELATANHSQTTPSNDDRETEVYTWTEWKTGRKSNDRKSRKKPTGEKDSSRSPSHSRTSSHEVDETSNKWGKFVDKTVKRYDEDRSISPSPSSASSAV
ncbi:hypothetical protein BDF20DRAFT_916368 [Mycotypha africana]|uniref:uncharacterized protein n=1 Tax=Mycotypha africana TaxID=64632 RepID=UPI0023017758|nr:uncharacterized protein BDF20DRAFT_916368 [Mycotypha africana]KAI8968941.1 hypothetical protein BDF20DRAFT_916368 [Mycotypha africana]